MTIPLRDGTELRVAAGGVYAGETRYGLEQIQDARQVSPDPETIGLRVQGVGLVSLVPARAGDAAVALDTLYQLRPDLRPAGWVSPSSRSLRRTIPDASSTWFTPKACFAIRPGSSSRAGMRFPASKWIGRGKPK